MTKEPIKTKITQNRKNTSQFEQVKITGNLKQIKHKILILSGKGGVGKSTVAANLAVSLSLAGKSVGLLDIDIHGPSIPKILNLEGKAVRAAGDAILPVETAEKVKVMSIGFLLRASSDAVIWRGPMKYQMIKQFLTDVQWGRLDFLIVDSPPGTGDEPLSIVQLLENADGAIIVTTPQEVALSDVRKCISFCQTLKLPVLGVLENMSGFICPHCGQKTDIFDAGGGKNMATEMGVPFLGQIPIDPQIVRSCDSGRPFVGRRSQNKTTAAFSRVIQSILSIKRKTEKEKTNPNQKGVKKMRIAIPLTGGKLSQHFGHCEQFAIIEVDKDTKSIKSKELVSPPAHQPGVLPQWLAGLQVELIIAGGMGQRAQQLFTQNQIEVVVGASEISPEELASAYLDGRLQCGENICDH